MPYHAEGASVSFTGDDRCMCCSDVGVCGTAEFQAEGMLAQGVFVSCV